jgi:hypothetical protein
MQKSLVVKNIEFDLIHKWAVELTELSNAMAYWRRVKNAKGLVEVEKAVTGASQLMASMHRMNIEQMTLRDKEVASIVAELKSVAFYFESSKYAHRSERLALRRAIHFLTNQPFPVGSEGNNG